MGSRSQPQETSDDAPSRYVVGIDLGTTNSAVAFIDTQQTEWVIQTLEIPQLVAPGQVESRTTLPSFHYQPVAGQWDAAALRLPWSQQDANHAVGVLARDQGAAAPGRLIASAKSWLCHTGVDRTADLLPWHGAPDVRRLSPVDACSSYLEHIHSTWDAQHPHDPLAQQDIVLTLPASFDEVARELTVDAAARAGLPRVVLIEEPQAAFYAWIHRHAEDWQRHVEPGQKILVCDIGGGTSDFTLIRVRTSEDGKVQFHRAAVGDHLILGGDNFDLALAQYVESRLAASEGLDANNWSVLVRTCRQVKETLLSEAAPERLTINLGGSGSRLIGSAQQVEVTRDEVRELLLDGFLPTVGLAAKPVQRQSGFQEFGLPYAPDPAITRCLAAFLTAHRQVTVDDEPLPTDHDPARPDIVLLNGGVFAAAILQQRLLEVLANWFQSSSEHGPADPDWQPLVLTGADLNQAVAHGAAYYGMVRRGQGVRIAASLARTYYIGIEEQDESTAADARAVCLVPASAEPGRDVDLSDRQFHLLVSQPVEFPLYVSSTRLTDRPGELVAVDREAMTPLPPIRTVLRTRNRQETGVVAVNLHARLTEIGTVDLWCTDAEKNRSWRLQFDVRSTTQTDMAAHESAAEREGVLDEAVWDACAALIDATFGQFGESRPQQLVKHLAAAIGTGRTEWPTSLLRRIWSQLMAVEPGRRRGPAYEARWLNLLGFAMRPGYGLAMDDWRVAETWRTVQGKMAYGGPQCRVESWILWRRIAGGLSVGQQRAVANPLLASIRDLHRQLMTGRGRGGDASLRSQESIEAWRLLGSLELLDGSAKIELGRIMLDMMAKRQMAAVRPAIVWALGRLGTRVPMYGPLNVVLPVDEVAQWLEQLTAIPYDDASLNLAVMQMARRTDDRYRDLPEQLRRHVLEWLGDRDAPDHYLQLVQDGGLLDAEEQGRVFGESLPSGLRVASAPCAN